MSKKRNVISYEDYVKKKAGLSSSGKIVVGSDIVAAAAVDIAIEHSDVFVISNEKIKNSFEKIENNFEKFLEDPSPYLINAKCEERKFLSDFFTRSTKKIDFLKDIEVFLASSTFRKTRTDLLLVVDELFTNFSKVSRDDEPISFFIDSDKDRVLVGCRDSLGALEPTTMLKNIQKCYKFGVKDSISADISGGAGIGSFLMYNVAEGMALISEVGKQSLVLFWLSKHNRHNERVDSNKDIIVFKKGD